MKNKLFLFGLDPLLELVLVSNDVQESAEQ